MDSSLAEYQGPSVLVYNNSVFTREDFESLRQLGYSQKLEQRMATGKFGLGFSSVCPFGRYNHDYKCFLLTFRVGLRMDRLPVYFER